MDLIEQEIRVSFRYPVLFTRGIFTASNPALGDLLRQAAGEDGVARILFVVDSGVTSAHPGLVTAIETYCREHQDVLRLAGPVLVVPGGERIKNEPAELDALLSAIHAAALCRHSYLAVIGGGAVLDVAGYAAATAHRGIRLIRIPTTVLAQDDSALGVKNGVNSFGKKNYLGTFAPPFAVINDFAFLATLSDRDWRSGISEAVKAALIRDAAFFDLLETLAPALSAREAPAMEQVVRRSAALHLAHIATGGDPFELGSSRPLDFGHWAAHKLEQLTEHRLRHGEAVAAGIALDTTYSYLCGHLPERDWQRVLGLLRALGFALYVPELSQHLDQGDHPASVLGGLDEFREHLGGRLTIMLLHGIGRPFDVHEIDRDVMIRSIELVRATEESAAAAAARRAS